MEIHKNIKNIFDIGSRVDKIAVLVVYLFLLLSVDAFSTAVYKCVETILKLLDLPCYSVHWSGSPISLLKAIGLGSLASSADEEEDQKCSCSCRCRQIFWGRIHFSKHHFTDCVVIPLNMEVEVDLCAPADFLGALLLGIGGYIFRHFR